MRRLIEIEWMKLKRLLTLKAILLVYAVLVPTLYLLFSYVTIGPIMLPDAAYEAPGSYDLVAWVASCLNLMVGIIVIVFATNELKYKTQRQNVIDGLSKRDIIMSKFYFIIILSLIVTVYTFLVAFVISLINGSGSHVFEGSQIMGAYFLSTLGYFSFAFFFANLVRLPALAIVIYLFSTVIEWIVGYIVVAQYYQFFPLNTFAQMIPFPWYLVTGSAKDPDLMTTMESSILATVYILIFMASSYLIMRKRDV